MEPLSCPACGSAPLLLHCLRNAKCNWLRCPNERCNGYGESPTGERFRWAVPPPPSQRAA